MKSFNDFVPNSFSGLTKIPSLWILYNMVGEDSLYIIEYYFRMDDAMPVSYNQTATIMQEAVNDECNRINPKHVNMGNFAVELATS